MNSSLFITYLVAVTVLMLTPGPDMLFCLASGLNGGSRSGFLAAIGTATGAVVHLSASAAGLTAAIAAVPGLLDVVRIVGAGYLVWLGVRAWQHRNADIDDDTGQTPHHRSAYRRGLITNLLNPKMALFSIAFLPQFIDPQAGSVARQFVVLGACFVALEIAVDGTVGLLAGRLRRLLDGRRARRNLNLAGGSVYLGLAATVALQS